MDGTDPRPGTGRRARARAVEDHLVQVPPHQPRRCVAVHPATGRACVLDRGHELGHDGPAHFDGMNAWEASPRRPGEAAERPQERLEPDDAPSPAHCPPGALEVTRLEIGRMLKAYGPVGAGFDAMSSDAARDDLAGRFAMELQGQLEAAGYRVVLADDDGERPGNAEALDKARLWLAAWQARNAAEFALSEATAALQAFLGAS